MAIRILTDSTSDLSAEQARDQNVLVVPLRVNFGETSYRDGVEIDHAAFYERLRTADPLPTTSQPTPDDFLPAFLAAKEAGEPIIAILLASGISGTVQSASIAKGMADWENIFIVDSLTTAIGLHLLVTAAVRLRDAGTSAEEIVRTLEEEKQRVVLFAMVDTLHYLYKGGRLSRTSHIAGTLLHFKPIITLKDGKISVVGKARGTANGIRRMLDEVDSCGGMDLSFPVYLGYAQTQEACLQLQKQTQERFSQNAAPVFPIGAVVGTHAGPGTCAIAFLRRQ